MFGGFGGSAWIVLGKIITTFILLSLGQTESPPFSYRNKCIDLGRIIASALT
jgi:hypothetical protein